MIVLHARAAMAITVDVELQLLVDVSPSIDATEFALQRQGYFDAISSQQVKDAILNGPNGRIAAQFVYWAVDQFVVQDWVVLDSVAAIDAFAATILAQPNPNVCSFELFGICFGTYSLGGLTGIAEAVNFGAPMFGTNTDPVTGEAITSTRQVIDISSDGKQNTFDLDPNNIQNLTAIRTARDDAVNVYGVDQLNAIVIGSTNPDGVADFAEADLVQYYTDNVIAGDGSFVLGQTGFNSFSTGLTQKLVREISLIPLPAPVLLLLSGLGVLGGLRLRRRADG